MKKLFLYLFILTFISSLAVTLPTKEELEHIGNLIYKNETGLKRELLIHWNKGEEFPSLGIGHFIWYPENFKNGPFNESFPGLIAFYKKKNISVPSIFSTRYSPWTNIDDFNLAKKNGSMNEAIIFLESTKHIQIQYIYKRLESSLDKLISISANPEHIKKQFNRIAKSKNGLYPLIDYVNFKGEGIKESEKYQNKGWGLLQVLELMKGQEIGEKALNEFADSAIFVLNRRIQNSPKERGEKRWKKNWTKRCNSYRGHN
ncbi:MAG: hypothetical protein ACRC6K_01795 [Fusobacteriaceae bacterium]